MIQDICVLIIIVVAFIAGYHRGTTDTMREVKRSRGVKNEKTIL